MSSADVYTVLRLYASKKQNANVDFNDFAAYINKYAQRYAFEQPELKRFITDTLDSLTAETDKLEQEKKIIITHEKEAKIIIVSSFYRDQLILRYKEINNNAAIPFPFPADLGKNFPEELMVKKEAAELLYALLDEKTPAPDLSENTIYCLTFKKEVNPIVMPLGFSPGVLLELSFAKIRRIMTKTGQHDFYLKKMVGANSGRDVSAKAFFTQFVSQTSSTMQNLKNGGESYFFWNQLITFIRADYEKIQDKIPDDFAVLQALNVVEIGVSYYRTKTQMNLQKETALKNLDLALEKPPYYYTLDTISLFTDSHGVPLLGQFDQEDLNQYMQKATTNTVGDKLPKLLSFRTENGERYFILKEKVVPLIIKLCSDCREKLRSLIVKEWYDKLINFENESAMTEQKEFEKKLEVMIKANSPIMYALLKSTFISVVYQEAQDAQDKSALAYKLFANGNLLPFSDLLILNRQTLLTDAKILLPVVYTIPFISFLYSLFFKKNAQKIKEEQTAVVTLGAKKPDDDVPSSAPQKSKKIQKEELKKAAAEIEKDFVPQKSTLDLEVNKCINEWNRMLDKQAKKDLTEDVNSLIRDYMRKTLRSLGASNFNTERVNNLAQTLLERTDAFQKIKNQDALLLYIKLYIVQIVKKM